MIKFIKKYHLLIILYIILLLIFTNTVIGFSIVIFGFYLAYKLSEWLGFGNCCNDDESDNTPQQIQINIKINKEPPPKQDQDKDVGTSE